MTRRLAVVAVSVVALAWTAVLAAGSAERAFTIEQDLAADRALRVENLIGSITVTGGGPAGKVRLDVRVVAEGETPAEAEDLASAIAVEPREDSGALLLHVTYPVDRNPSFRLPRGEVDGGRVARWIAPLFKRGRTAMPWDGRIVEMGPGRGAASIAVHVEARVPDGLEATFSQAVGAVGVARLRGTIVLENVEGGILAEQVYGALDAKSARGDVTVRSFQGETLAAATTSGDVRLSGVTARNATLKSASGHVHGDVVKAGDLDVETEDGDTVMAGVESTHFTLRTGSGAAEVDTGLVAAKSVAIETDSGNVTLRVGPNARFSLSARTPREVEFKGISGLDLVGRNEGVAEYRRGGGGAEVSIASATGRVEVSALSSR